MAATDSRRKGRMISSFASLFFCVCVRVCLYNCSVTSCKPLLREIVNFSAGVASGAFL